MMIPALLAGELRTRSLIAQGLQNWKTVELRFSSSYPGLESIRLTAKLY
jgi:hypothetical protein